jgi:hypothetical protein
VTSTIKDIPVQDKTGKLLGRGILKVTDGPDEFYYALMLPEDMALARSRGHVR